MYYGKVHTNKTLIDKHLYGLPVDAVNFHLAVFGVKLHTQCTSNTFIETDVYDYVQWWTEILRQAHLHGHWCAKHESGGGHEDRTGPNLHQWVRSHATQSKKLSFES